MLAAFLKVLPRAPNQGKGLKMMQMTDMPIGMMWGMGLVWLLIVVLLLLGIAACIKYLRS